jgi:hypothetical protein
MLKKVPFLAIFYSTFLEQCPLNAASQTLQV